MKKKKEKPFSRLTKAEKRIAICEDVLAQLKAKTIIATKGTYVWAKFKDTQLSYYEKEKLNRSQLNKLIQTNQVTCKACALGSIFLGHVNKTNHCTTAQSNENSSQEMRERLQILFPLSELELIETAFEKGVVTNKSETLQILRSGIWIKTPLAVKAVKFGNKYKTDDGRLKAIMLNIIKNGEFKP